MSNTIDSIIAARRQSQAEESGSEFYALARVDGAEHFLELRFRDGVRAAFSYDKLGWFNFSPDTGMLDADFMGTIVSIEGRGLDELFLALKMKKVSWVKEADTELQDNDANATFIKEITILPPPDEPEGKNNGQ
jgi:hypothetical protein